MDYYLLDTLITDVDRHAISCKHSASSTFIHITAPFKDKMTDGGRHMRDYVRIRLLCLTLEHNNTLLVLKKEFASFQSFP